MELVEVDAVGAQPAQAVLERAPHVFGPGAAPLLVDRHAELGGEHDLIPAPGERLAEILLALGAAVDVGGVEEVDAGVERRVDDARRGRGVEAAAEVVAAEPDHRDLERADASRFHERAISRCLHSPGRS